MVETRSRSKKAPAPKGVRVQASTSQLPTRPSKNNRKTVQKDPILPTSKTTPLDRLINLLTRVRDNGLHETFALDVWDGESNVSFANQVHPPYPHDLLALRRELSEAKTCMEALQDIRYRLGRRIRILQNRCTPLALSDGLNRMPDEILANVFEMGYKLSDDYKFSLTVSHVCHRFRAVALKIPLLWTRLDTYVAPPLTMAFVSRTGRMHLDVKFSSKYNMKPDRIEKFLDILHPSADRWYRLRLSSMPSKSQMQSLPHQLPHLRFLECYGTYPEYLGISTISILSCKAFSIPPSSQRLRITACDLTLGTSEDVRAAVRALHEMKNLRDLSLTFDMCRSDGNELYFQPYDDEEADDWWHGQFSLNTMSLTVNEFTDLPVVRQLYDKLEFHSIAKTTISLDKLTETEYSTGFLYYDEGDDIIFRAPFMTFQLSRCTDGYNSWESFDLLTESLGAHPPRHTIHIDSPLVSFIDQKSAKKSAKEKPWTSYSSLRHLQLKNCDRLCEWQLQAFADKLVFPEEGKGLQSLEIISCRGITEDFLLELREIMGNKLSWVL